ncbi:Ger(x)C family germination protein [Virgibacillus natechei]|uniref:Ger(X)C family germination protein n=1 Tax=Virgibacillus natechei TaxID=1216297 RepID=A0ABS4IE12_9BACI|nr:Ger(x)C family spore germination protein [Virgibacillus natechei]MBP1969172.1 Ger(x)C family germination protein [Virgibacillus natechei]UZD14425.1 Ger(x)C family spore germination protein [Virgibacillus natechei]
MSNLKSKIIIAGYIVLLIPVLVGCWDSQELNEISIITALGIDKQEDQYQLSVQIINPGEISAQTNTDPLRSEVTTYSVVSDTLFEGLRKLTTKVPKKLYNSHIRTVIIGEELVRNEGIGKVLDFLSRDHEIRTDFSMIIAKETTAKSILNIVVPMEKIPGQKMLNSLEESHVSFGSTVPVTLDLLINDLVSKGNHPVMTGIQILGDPESGRTKSNVSEIAAPTLLEYSGVAAFKNEQLVG